MNTQPIYTGDTYLLMAQVHRPFMLPQASFYHWLCCTVFVITITCLYLEQNQE